MNTDIKISIEHILENKELNEQAILSRLKQLILEKEIEQTAFRQSATIGNLAAENLDGIKLGDISEYVVPSGFRDFDKLVGGFSLGELVVIGGRPAMGKTQFMINLARNISSKNPCLYFTFDLSAHSLTTRVMSSVTSIPAFKILQHRLDENEKETLAQNRSTFDHYRLHINDSCSHSLSAFKAQCLKHIREDAVQVIFVDYLQLMSTHRYRGTRELEISYITRELKNIARDNKVCVIAASQLSRSVETRGGDKRPILSDLRESGAIEQDADKVLFLYRGEYYGLETDMDGNSTAGVADIIIAKNRNGSLGTIHVNVDKKFTNFSDFEGYKQDFTFSKSRFDEIKAPF